MGAPGAKVSPATAQEHLEELARLTDTAGGSVVGTVQQRISRPSPSLYIGKGKAEELASAVALAKADLVIFDEDLSPVQGQNLERALGVRVMDRSELILDIFATRARSSEAKMQVELAQLEYLLPRLTRMWNHLSRIRGGIGLRGPGETQLETDRRLIGERIADLKKKLRTVATSRATRRKARAGAFRVALVGYTNAGKSSLLQALSGAELFVEDRLFATLDPSTRAVDLGDGFQALVTDTVGFIRKLPHRLIASFRSTLEEAREADLLLHVVDGAQAEFEESIEVVREVLEELDLLERPRAMVFNKMDLLAPDVADALMIRQRALQPLPTLFVSVFDETSLAGLRAFLKARLLDRLVPIEVRVPVSEGGVIAAIHREGEVMGTQSEGQELVIRARVPRALLGRLRSRDDLVLMKGTSW